MKPDTQERPETKTFICPSCKRYYTEPLPVQCACGQTSRFFEETHPSNAVRAENKERPDFEKAAEEYCLAIHRKKKSEGRIEYRIAQDSEIFKAGCNHGYDLSRKRIEELEAVVRNCYNELTRYGIPVELNELISKALNQRKF